MGLIEAIGASAPASALRTSFYVYPVVNAAHILALGMLVTSAILMDLRVLGLGRGIALPAVIAALRPVAITALVAALITGGLLFIVQPVTYAGNPAFLAKLALLALALLNAAAFTLSRAHLRPEHSLTRLMAGLSILLWLCVLLAGRFIGFLVG
ncbi:hypothetical protein EMQ25_09535 [Arsenicitalea aurantiaca]|uniref:DUF2214 domain-containing protein n=1 Tax=Arsenicitalea aurantiaca TaxID=1783274 RepID=A0A433XAK9_9HYPH|nr:hypothetical protein [Arsenicitalea aurantiaca]RUT31105.1 hypothetical protein EMQ25_09535 [Arsenicitalea aurantiaca]